MQTGFTGVININLLMIMTYRDTLKSYKVLETKKVVDNAIIKCITMSDQIFTSIPLSDNDLGFKIFRELELIARTYSFKQR